MADDHAHAPPPAPVARFDQQVARIGWRSWSALGALGAVLGVVLVWSVWGDIPTRVRGSCIIMHAQGVSDISSDVNGRISALLVKPGQYVAAGQEVARVATPDLYERLLAARQAVSDLEAQATLLRQQSGSSLRLGHDSLEEQRRSLQQRVAGEQQRVDLLAQQAALQARFRAQGLVTARAVTSAELDLADARTNLADSQRRLLELDKQEAELARRHQGALARLQQQSVDAQRQLAALEQQQGALSRLRAPSAGRIVEIKAGLDAPVKRDMAVLSLERIPEAGSALEAVMFVSAADGKKIAAGQSAELLPSHARREEHGLLRAAVSSASAYPASPQGLMNTIANADLMRELAHGTATYEVRLQLARASSAGAAVNDFDWTQANGRSVPVSSGTLCQGEILVRHEKPLALVLPIFSRRLQGAP